MGKPLEMSGFLFIFYRKMILGGAGSQGSFHPICRVVVP